MAWTRIAIACGLLSTASVMLLERGAATVNAQDAPTAENAGQNRQPALPPRAPTEDFVIATWNLEWFFDDFSGDNFSDLSKQQSAPDRKSWEWKRDGVAAAIAQSKPDVIALQEIEGQRSMFYLTTAIMKQHQTKYTEAFVEGADFFTEQDVSLLFRSGIEMTRMSRYRQSKAMFESDRFHNVSKHVEAVFEIPVGDSVEKVTVMNLHFLARAEQVERRTRQARLIHAWLADRIAAGENVIVLGDTNSEETSYPPAPGTDIAALSGLDTPQPEDDLVDLGQYLPEDQRRTHMLEGKHFDRILVSPSLIADDPSRPDLVFSVIERKRELAVKGKDVDSQSEHWEHYWVMDEKERDLSDHWPLFARFSVK